MKKMFILNDSNIIIEEKILEAFIKFYNQKEELVTEEGEEVDKITKEDFSEVHYFDSIKDIKNVVCF